MPNENSVMVELNMNDINGVSQTEINNYHKHSNPGMMEGPFA